MEKVKEFIASQIKWNSNDFGYDKNLNLDFCVFLIAAHVLVMWLLPLPILFTLDWREQISSFSSWLPHSNSWREIKDLEAC